MQALEKEGEATLRAKDGEETEEEAKHRVPTRREVAVTGTHVATTIIGELPAGVVPWCSPEAIVVHEVSDPPEGECEDELDENVREHGPTVSEDDVAELCKKMK